MTLSRARFVGLLLIAFLAAVFAEARWIHGLESISNRVGDSFLRSYQENWDADPGIVVVAIDEASLTHMADYAGRWPWPRTIYAELIAGIAAQRPKAIVFDMMFAEPDLDRPESDQEFNRVIAQYPNVYFASARHNADGDTYGVPIVDIAAGFGVVRSAKSKPDAKIDVLLPRALDQENWRMGLVNFTQDRDGVGRRYLLNARAYGWQLPSLPTRVARDLGWALPDRDDIMLGWRHGFRPRATVSLVDLYADLNNEIKQRSPREFRNKVVVIGVTATGLHDVRVTPVSNALPGVEILATALDNLKNRQWLNAAPASWTPILATVLLALLAAAFMSRLNSVRIAIGFLALSAALLMLSYVQIGRGTWMPVVSPLIFAWTFLLICTLRDFLEERQIKERAVREFSRFVNPHVVNELVARGGLSRQGESRMVTMLFSDIRGFTTLSETRSANEVVELLNRYFSRQVDVVFRHGGTLDKFIGDAIMACWGAPLDNDSHARHAVSAALDMADALDDFKVELGESLPDFDVGIGLNTGLAVVGLIGSDARREYTAIGDTVNLASRIEGLTKGVARILVSEDTKAQCGDAFEFVDHGLFKVKGREKEVRLFEPRRKLV